MDDLIVEFIEETIESLSELDMDLVKLEQDPENEELLAKIFRLMHTIKGTCGFLGLPRLEKTAHAAENLLDLFRTGQMDVTEMRITVLFLAIDRVRYLVGEIEQNGKEPDGDDADIISQIDAEIAGGTKNKGDESATGADSDVITEDVFGDDDFEGLPENDAEVANAAEEGEVESSEDLPVAEESEGEHGPEPEPEQTKPTAADKVILKAAPEKTPEFLKVQMGVLEDLINMVSELVLTRNQLLQLVKLDEDSPASAPLQRLNRIVSDLQEGVMKTRMQPIGNAWAKLPRIIRDLTKELDKKVSLEMSGEDTELDRQVLEMIKDPLTHMVRNSCDHGVEMPAERKAAGKPETGTVNLRAYHEGGFIIIEIEDDGKGLDARKIGEKALEKGLITSDKLENMTDKQLLQNIFKPGFSMAKEVTNVSGRGVGMDVVRTNIEKIGGTIDMDSTLGKGTKFTIQIPLTLAIISALIVEIDGLRYAMPQLNIQELVRTHSSDEEKIETINDRPVFRLRDRILPLIDSKTLFNNFIANDDVADQALSDAHEKTDTDMNLSDKLIVVVSAGASYFGLVVDAIHDMEEIVIKSISSVLHDTKIFAGNTILGDGQVIMILDPAGIARLFEVSNDMSANDSLSNDAGKVTDLRISEKASMLVFRAGGEAPKAMPLALISRLQRFQRGDLTCSGDQIVVKYANGLLPLYLTEPDLDIPSGDEVTALILSDDVSDAAMGIIIEEVVDIMEDHLDLATSTARDGVIGSVPLKGITVDVVDIAYYLGQTKEDFFSVQTHSQAPYEAVPVGGQQVKQDYSGQTRVLIVDDSPFFRNMLKPILVSAGFNVMASEDPIEAMKLHDNGHMFDVILSDIEMPNMNGYEFVEKMKKESDWKDLPFIAITSHTTTQDVEYGYQKGFTKYIGKFDKDELLRTMSTVLSSS